MFAHNDLLNGAASIFIYVKYHLNAVWLLNANFLFSRFWLDYNYRTKSQFALHQAKYFYSARVAIIFFEERCLENVKEFLDDLEGNFYHDQLEV